MSSSTVSWSVPLAFALMVFLAFLWSLFLSAWSRSASFVSGVAFLPLRHAAVLAAALLLLSRCDQTADLLPKLPLCSAPFSHARRLLSNCLCLCSTVCLFRAYASSVCRLDHHRPESPRLRFRTAPGQNRCDQMPVIFDESCIQDVRALSADIVEKGNSGHPGMLLGCAPFAHVLWSDVMKFSPTEPGWFNRDRFVLSNGHGCVRWLGTMCPWTI
jgi:hypothetical protein